MSSFRVRCCLSLPSLPLQCHHHSYSLGSQAHTGSIKASSKLPADARLAAREAALAKEVGTSKGELDTSRGIARAPLGSLRKAVAQMRPGA